MAVRCPRLGYDRSHDSSARGPQARRADSAVPGAGAGAPRPGGRHAAARRSWSLLLLSLLALVLYWLHRWLTLRLQWVAAWLLAPLGGVAYLLWPNDQW